jgi:type I site-specific restriction-modification system R (restriction) subunit
VNETASDASRRLDVHAADTRANINFFSFNNPAKRRELVWHTQSSGKTFTMITAAERLF